MASFFLQQPQALSRNTPASFLLLLLLLLVGGDFSFCSSCRVASVCMCLFLYSREIRLLSTLRCFRRYIADFILSIQIFPALKNNDQVFMTGLNLARIWNMELQGIAKCAFHLNHDFIPSSFQAAAVFKKHRFFLVSCFKWLLSFKNMHCFFSCFKDKYDILSK